MLSNRLFPSSIRYVTRSTPTVSNKDSNQIIVTYGFISSSFNASVSSFDDRLPEIKIFSACKRLRYWLHALLNTFNIFSCLFIIMSNYFSKLLLFPTLFDLSDMLSCDLIPKHKWASVVEADAFGYLSTVSFTPE